MSAKWKGVLWAKHSYWPLEILLRQKLSSNYHLGCLSCSFILSRIVVDTSGLIAVTSLCPAFWKKSAWKFFAWMRHIFKSHVIRSVALIGYTSHDCLGLANQSIFIAAEHALLSLRSDVRQHIRFGRCKS